MKNRRPTSQTEKSELIAQFTSRYQEIEAFRPKYEAAVAKREAEIARSTGLAPHHTFRTAAEEDRHLAVMRVVDEEMGFDKINDKMEALASKLDPLVQAIISTPAQNLEDLALKANAAATVLFWLWQTLPTELDCPQAIMRDLIENVCALANLNIAANPRAIPPKGLN
jgi:hypothetical protein